MFAIIYNSYKSMKCRDLKGEQIEKAPQVARPFSFVGMFVCRLHRNPSPPELRLPGHSIRGAPRDLGITPAQPGRVALTIYVRGKPTCVVVSLVKLREGGGAFSFQTIRWVPRTQRPITQFCTVSRERPITFLSRFSPRGSAAPKNCQKSPLLSRHGGCYGMDAHPRGFF
jgi:hypothetical protein